MVFDAIRQIIDIPTARFAGFCAIFATQKNPRFLGIRELPLLGKSMMLLWENTESNARMGHDYGSGIRFGQPLALLATKKRSC